MELSLKLLTGRSAGQELKVPVSKFLIGRAEDCHLRPHSDLVSRHHCVLLVEEGFCAVRDFGSKNGTQVNEERVVGQRELHNGDRIKIGVLEFEIQLTSSVGGKKKPKVKDVKDAAVRTAAGSPPKKEEDEDISDWLSAGDEDTNTETRRVDPAQQKKAVSAKSADMSVRETTFMKSPTEETTTVKPLISEPAKKPEPQKPTAQQPAPEEPPKETPAKGSEAAKRLFGTKLAAAKPSGPKNSQDAANEALKKLFNARNS